MKNYAIILAGGSGSRMNMEIPKQFLPLKEKPIIAWSMEAFESINDIDAIIVVVDPKYFKKIEEIAKKYKINKFLKSVSGGKTRQESSLNAIKSINFDNNDILLLHDAARPFITKEIIKNSIEFTKEYGASAVYVPAIDTITEINNNIVTNIPDRKNLFYAQTPQSFTFNIINDAHKNFDNTKLATDDVSLVLNNNKKIYKIIGNYSNLKITTEFDYKIAKQICK